MRLYIYSENNIMKRIFIFFIFIFIQFNLIAQFKGIWEGKDRIVFFEEQENNQYKISIILKEYYGWYYDRTSEPDNYNEREPRTINAGTTKESVHLKVNILPAETTDTFILEMIYSKSQKNYVPVFLKDDSMYLDFYTKETSDNENYTFWKGNSVSKGIMVSPQITAENISGCIIDGDKIYNIRYWKSKMDFSSESASVKYENSEYLIPKHIYCSDTNYSCVSGRSKNVRNVQPPLDFDSTNYIFNQNQTVFTKNTEPYLKRIKDKETFEQLMEIINTANSRRKPAPKPVFPVTFPKYIEENFNSK